MRLPRPLWRASFENAWLRNALPAPSTVTTTNPRPSISNARGAPVITPPDWGNRMGTVLIWGPG
jgi:hypothetical protein